jgi:hypothetical protein
MRSVISFRERGMGGKERGGRRREGRKEKERGEEKGREEKRGGKRGKREERKANITDDRIQMRVIDVHSVIFFQLFL